MFLGLREALAGAILYYGIKKSMKSAASLLAQGLPYLIYY